MQSMKPTFTCLLFIFLVTYCTRPTSHSATPINPDQGELIGNISVEILAEGDWVEDVRILNQYLKFDRNGRFQHKISFEGCGASNGRFHLSGKQLTFSEIQEVEGCTPWFTEKTTCNIVNTPNNLDFIEILKCQANGAKEWQDDFQFANRKKPQRPEALITLDGAISRVSKPKAAQIIENAVFRKQPKTDAARAVFRESIDCPEGNDQEQSYLPKGQKISILAKTKERSSVGKWNNYWYYVCPITCEVYMGQGCYFKGWVYGEFVRE